MTWRLAVRAVARHVRALAADFDAHRALETSERRASLLGARDSYTALALELEAVDDHKSARLAIAVLKGWLS